MRMKYPPHPGTVVPHDSIEPLSLTITDATAALHVTRTTLSEMVNGKRGISTEMAVHLEHVIYASEKKSKARPIQARKVSGPARSTRINESSKLSV